MAVKEFGFGNNDSDYGKSEHGFKAEKGNTYLVSFVCWPGLEEGKLDLDASTPRWFGEKTIYFDKIGPVISRGPEYISLAKSLYPNETNKAMPKYRMGTLLVIWPSNKKGELDKEKFAAGEIDVKYWVHGDMEKYDQLKSLHNGFHFGSYDLKIVCTNTDFQKMTFTPENKKSILRSLKEGADTNPKYKEVYNNIITQAQNLIPELDRKIGRDITIEELKKTISGNAPSGSTSSASEMGKHVSEDVDVDDLLSDL